MSAILETFALGSPPWRTFDPFLFCVHHLDAYPEGDEAMAPRASLAGREIGMDFSGKDGWSMYHGDAVPGFPRHPHRGFETVTLARRGFIDHSDSLGATARFGDGDCQWMTAGRGIVHCEMFPLVRRDAPNPGELFQIWLNLPPEDKMVDPHFTMLWSEAIPRVQPAPGVEAAVVAGALAGARAPAPPPSSWASRPDAHVAIWPLVLEAGARLTLPAGPEGLNRTAYFFDGQRLTMDGRRLEGKLGVRLRSDAEVALENGPTRSEVLVLQGRPIGAPVVQYGPFVMNTKKEILEAFQDYQTSEFGGWPWPSDAPAHAREEGRFAIHADGRVERPGAAAE
jgi:redox-sensitive bicupin YhaK (pirin superfamily)